MSESGALSHGSGEESLPLPAAVPAPAACKHDYAFDADIEQWVCRDCGRSMDLVAKHARHECGPDCDEHGEIDALG